MLEGDVEMDVETSLRLEISKQCNRKSETAGG